MRVGWSRPSRGAWIETTPGDVTWTFTKGRALHGARGLKPLAPIAANVRHRSRPSRGAWIETELRRLISCTCLGRALHGARGLKRGPRPRRVERARVAPFTGRVD